MRVRFSEEKLHLSIRITRQQSGILPGLLNKSRFDCYTFGFLRAGGFLAIANKGGT
jgi:hypothetical protein